MGKKIKIKDLLNLEKIGKYSPELLEYFEKGGTWQELLGYNEGVMEASYKKAHDYYQNGDYQHALDVFSYLTVINPYNYIYWMGLGMSRQHLLRFEEAIVAYTVARAVSSDHPQPHLQLAQCYHTIEQPEMAKKHLRKTIENAAKFPEHAALAEKARHILENLR